MAPTPTSDRAHSTAATYSSSHTEITPRHHTDGHSLPLEVNRTLEPTIRRLDTVTDRISYFEQVMDTLQKQIAILKMCTQRTQQQADTTEATFRSTNLGAINHRLAGLEQNVLNLQLQMQAVADNYNQLYLQGVQDRQQVHRLTLRPLQIHSNSVAGSHQLLRRQSPSFCLKNMLRSVLRIAGAKLRTPSVSILISN